MFIYVRVGTDHAGDNCAIDLEDGQHVASWITFDTATFKAGFSFCERHMNDSIRPALTGQIVNLYGIGVVQS